MAGDWIKMRADLRDDPAVFRIAQAIAKEDLYVIGALLCFWAWIDKHSVDGHVDGATSQLVDHVTHTPGMADAMQSVQWLVIDESGIAVPNFDRHNGETAKERGLKNARQARWRQNKDGDPSTPPSTPPPTDASTREEKRREEVKEERPRATRLASDWTLPDEWKAYCETARPDLNPTAVAENFSDWWHAKAGKDGAKLDWFATWRGWVRKEAAPKGKPAGRDGYVPGVGHTRVVL